MVNTIRPDASEPSNPRNERVQALYESISDRLGFENKPLALADRAKHPGNEEAADKLNKVFYNVGALLEELALQCNDKVDKNPKYESALNQIALLSEFIVQLAERNPNMYILPNTSHERLRGFYGDQIKSWIGNFQIADSKPVEFEIFVRPKAFDKFDSLVPGKTEESRQPRFSATLRTWKYQIGFRLDPEERTVTIDIDTPTINQLSFDNVNQHLGHHFKTTQQITTDEFSKVLEVTIAEITSREHA